ncbi:hypothetical protein SNR37_001716 [Agarivorans aestuarii]|uniref:Uncharacterized protein n=1 Tax=Agarivorans aestuarii TaxID=1563703 RepID=A0ABU7FZH0_9ALTE|nr:MULTISPECIES: hypothetical protein [Agarivorans]MEE1672395.1 hypothetical protein [Agarivorans aestuarii]
MLRKILLVVIVLSLLIAWFSHDLVRAVFEATAFLAVLVMLGASLLNKSRDTPN